MPIDLFEWSCGAVGDAIREVAENPPVEAASLIERAALLAERVAVKSRADEITVHEQHSPMRR